MLCRICSERPATARGRCHRCASYFHRHAVERPTTGLRYAGPGGSGWKGDGASEDSKRNRAQRRFILTECERCGRPGEVRHHRDDNPGNNTAANVEILCKRCHQQHHMGKPPRPCEHCGDLSKKLKRGRCNVCYQYLRVNGADRPESLIASARTRRAVLQGGDPSPPAIHRARA